MSTAIYTQETMAVKNKVGFQGWQEGNKTQWKIPRNTFVTKKEWTHAKHGLIQIGPNTAQLYFPTRKFHTHLSFS